MTGNALAKVRSFLVRGLAVMAVVLTYTVGSVGMQVASMVGLTGLALTTSATPAQAYWRRRVVYRRYRPYRRYRVRRYRRR